MDDRDIERFIQSSKEKERRDAKAAGDREGRWFQRRVERADATPSRLRIEDTEQGVELRFQRISLWRLFGVVDPLFAWVFVFPLMLVVSVGYAVSLWLADVLGLSMVLAVLLGSAMCIAVLLLLFFVAVQLVLPPVVARLTPRGHFAVWRGQRSKTPKLACEASDLTVLLEPIAHHHGKTGDKMRLYGWTMVTFGHGGHTLGVGVSYRLNRADADRLRRVLEKHRVRIDVRERAVIF